VPNETSTHQACQRAAGLSIRPIDTNGAWQLGPAANRVATGNNPATERVWFRLYQHAGIKTAASIQPVEFQHAAILYFVLGKYPVPSAFAGTSLARPLSGDRT